MTVAQFRRVRRPFPGDARTLRPSSCRRRMAVPAMNSRVAGENIGGNPSWPRNSRSIGSTRPRSRPKPAVPKAVKAEVEARAREFIDTVLKPKHVKPPPKDARFNYLADITCKWHGPTSICRRLRLPRPQRHLADLRVEARPPAVRRPGPLRPLLPAAHGAVDRALPGPALQKCLETIRDDPWFIPA